jgi:hypothetical protein
VQVPVQMLLERPLVRTWLNEVRVAIPGGACTWERLVPVPLLLS